MAVHLDEETIQAINWIDEALKDNSFVIDNFEIDTNGLGEQIINIRLRRENKND